MLAVESFGTQTRITGFSDFPPPKCIGIPSQIGDTRLCDPAHPVAVTPQHATTSASNIARVLIRSIFPPASACSILGIPHVITLNAYRYAHHYPTLLFLDLARV